MEKERANRSKLHWERFRLNIRKKFFSQNNQSLEQPSQRCGRVPITGAFLDAECLTSLIRLYFSQKVGLDDILKSLPTSAVL